MELFFLFGLNLIWAKPHHLFVYPKEKRKVTFYGQKSLYTNQREKSLKNQAWKTIFFSNGLGLQNKLQKTDTKNEISCVTTKKKEILWHFLHHTSKADLVPITSP